MNIEPRPYQKEALETVLSNRLDGITRQLVVLPTGCGKTILFGMLARELNTRTLIIAHRDQLVKQAADKVSLVWPEASIGVCMAEQNNIDAQVVIASVQSATQPKRLKALKEKGFGLCVVDEAHHTASNSYKKMLSELGFLNKDPEKLLVGVTATPSRAEGGLEDIFEGIVFERSISTMIRAGYLCDIKGHRILTSTNLEGVRSYQGDFAESHLSEVCNTPKRNQLIVDSYLEHALKRKGIAFTCDVEHAIDLAEVFKIAGVPSSAIYGSMPDKEKDSIMQQYACGELRILTNCSLLTEGYDEPDISTVLMCRPTRSQSLYIQCVGRGTRLHPSKTDCLVLDFCDNFHDINSIATLEKTVLKDSDSKENHQECLKQEQGPRTVFIGQQIVGEFDLFDRSNFAWTPVKEHWHIQLSPELSLWLKKGNKGYLPVLQQEEHQTHLVSREIPLDYAMGMAEDWIRKNRDLTIWASKNAQWRQDTPSDKQLEILSNLGVNCNDLQKISKGEASQLIGQKLNEKNLWRHEPATSSQRYFLSSYGLKIPVNLSKGEAHKLISSIKSRERIT